MYKIVHALILLQLRYRACVHLLMVNQCGCHRILQIINLPAICTKVEKD